jgi:putative peptidoglycan lipid II flippase
MLGIVGAFQAPRWLDVDPRWGVAFLALGSALAGWIEWYLLRRAVRQRIGLAGAGAALWKLWSASGVAGLAAWVTGSLVSADRHLVRGVAVAGVFALMYGVATLMLQVPAAVSLASQLRLKRPG